MQNKFIQRSTKILTTFMFLLFLFSFSSCRERKENEDLNPIKISEIDSIKSLILTTNNTNVVEIETNDFENYFIVIIDTNLQYYNLHQKMFQVHKALHIPIDTMGRLYNSEKNLIALPENNEDEIYKGTFFPRRDPSDFLSLEYLDYYHAGSKEKMICLVSGIYESESIADSNLREIKKKYSNAFKLKSRIFIGCMH